MERHMNGRRLLEGRFGMTCLCRRLRGTGSVDLIVVKLAEKTAEKRLSKRHLRVQRLTRTACRRIARCARSTMYRLD